MKGTIYFSNSDFDPKLGNLDFEKSPFLILNKGLIAKVTKFKWSKNKTKSNPSHLY